MHKKLNRKGFTITELVIVIVVIAILAAVLIPTFVSLIKKAKTAGDIQLVRNLNTIVATETTVSGGEISPHGAIVAVGENGYMVEKITPTADGRTIVWDATNYRFALLDENGEEIYPKDDKSGTPKANLFVISATYPAEGYEEYAVYLTEGCTLTEINATTGVDVGLNEQITTITYTGSESVAVRGAKYTTIVVKSGTVHHYDEAWTAYENGGTYVEHGTLNIPVQSGEYVDNGFAGGTGTESDPYIVTNLDHWNNLAADSKGENEFATSGKHYVIGADLVFDSNFKTIGHFSGTIDFQNHTVTCTEDMPESNWIDYAENNTTIKNLNVNNSATNFSLVYANTEAIAFENVTINGNYETNYNNAGAFVMHPGYTSEADVISITLENCNNYATINSSNGFSGIFIGTFNYLPEGKTAHVVMKDCANYGTLTGVNAAMIVSSSGSKNFNAATVKMYLENVRNYGAIVGSEYAGLVMSKAAIGGYYEYVEGGKTRGQVLFYSDESFADQYLITDANGERVKLYHDQTPAELDVKNGVNGVTKVGDFAEIITDGAGKLVFDNVVNGDATRYLVSFGWSGVFGAGNGGTFAYQIELDAANISTTDIMAYKWVNADTHGDDKALEASTLPTTDVTYGDVTLKVDSQNRYVFDLEGSHIRKQPTITVYAFDANNNVVAMGTYTYPAN